MKATEQYFPVVLFIMLYKMVLTFASPPPLFSLNIDWSQSNIDKREWGPGRIVEVRMIIVK